MVSGFSPSEFGSDPSEVARLLWTAIGVAGVMGLLGVARPTWRWVAGLVAAGLVWLWIDMEGPVLVARGSHGLHLADIPVVIVLAAAAVAAVRLVSSRRSRRARRPSHRSQ